MERRLTAAMVILCLTAAAVAGCASPRKHRESKRPSAPPERAAATATAFWDERRPAAAAPRKVELAAYLPPETGRWTFARAGGGAEVAAARGRGKECSRCQAAKKGKKQGAYTIVRRVEGDRVVGRWRDQPGYAVAYEKGTLAVLARARGSATEILVPPLALFPAALAIGEEWRAESAVLRVRGGRLPAEGKVVRTVRLVAVEPVRVGAGPFEGCLKLETSFESRVGKERPETLIETVWLARGIGIVKREHVPTEVAARFAKDDPRYRTETLELLEYRVDGAPRAAAPRPASARGGPGEIEVEAVATRRARF